jgi:hypothetical protein
VGLVGQPLRAARWKAAPAGVSPRFIHGDVTRVPELGVGVLATQLRSSGSFASTPTPSDLLVWPQHQGQKVGPVDDATRTAGAVDHQEVSHVRSRVPVAHQASGLGGRQRWIGGYHGLAHQIAWA